MAKTILITLTTAGDDTGPFDLYSNTDGFLVPFETDVPKLDLEAGYISYLVPDDALIIRVQSTNVLCENYIDLVIGTTTSTTSTSSTSSTSSTTTTSTTLSPSEYDFYLADLYSCSVCSLLSTNNLVVFPTGTPVTINNYYTTVSASDQVYRITSVTTPSIGGVILTTTGNSASCVSVPCLGG